MSERPRRLIAFMSGNQAGTTLIETIDALSALKLRRTWLWGGLSVASVLTLLQLYIPWVLKLLFDILTSGRGADLPRIVLILAVTGVTIAVLESLKSYIFKHLAELALVDLRARLYGRLQCLPMARLQDDTTGSLMSVFTSDAPAMVKLCSIVLRDAIISVCRLAAFVTILVVLYGWFAALAVAATGLYVLTPIVITPRLRQMNDELRRLNADSLATLQEGLSAAREVRAFNRTSWDLERVSQRFRVLEPLQARIGALDCASAANVVLYWLTSAALYGFGGQKVIANEMTLGSLFALVWYFTSLDGPARNLLSLNGQLQSALSAAQRVIAILDSTPHPGDRRPVEHLQAVKGCIRFEDVSFRYTGDRQVLDRLSFTVSAGQRVAIVGPSGAGKSTIVSLILRLYDADAGRILIDGHEIRDMSHESLRAQVSVVFQETFLFNLSVWENIRFGRPDATDADILEAAKAAGVDDFVPTLPRGYETVVGERGVGVSGGQRQRIAIARALLRDPRILLLDEATASLDAQAESSVCEALERLMRGRTCLIITHRLSTIAAVDDIVVLNQGRVAEAGRHEQLMKCGGLYRATYDLQFATGQRSGSPVALAT